MSKLSEQAALKLAPDLADRIFWPGSGGYAAALRIWAKPSLETRPRAVIRCQTANDVQAAIRIAREHDLPVSVRCGGHDWAGRALCNGIVIDLGGMRQVTIMPGNHRVAMGGGALAADIAAVTDRQHSAVAAGSFGCVGMAGLTLGGGYGPFIGRCG